MNARPQFLNAAAMPRFMISAAHKSSGKTTVATGLAAALREQSLAVRCFKKGPDYIDPMWLALASQSACYNLDPYLQSWPEIGALFQRVAQGADVSIVEGNKGLHDGLALDGSNSCAALAKRLALPVVLVLDARGMTRGIAPLLLGQQAFDREVNIAGVILNRVSGARHESKLRAVIERYTDIPVVGAIASDPRLDITERHLGLVPSNECPEALARVAAMARAIEEQVDLDRLMAIASSASALAPLAAARRALGSTRRRLRIGIARDAAFGFYYPDDLAALEAAGCELCFFDTLRDAHLPTVDGLFLGGGFPESFMIELEANLSLRQEIRSEIERGLPVYAECGGLMYLARSLSWQGRTAQMVGALPGDAVMHARPIGRGYVNLRPTGCHPWLGLPEPDATLRAHEFHYSSLENLSADCVFAYEVLRGHGIDGKHDGLVYRNVLGSYCHRRNIGTDRWAEQFVAFTDRVRAGGRSGAHTRLMAVHE